MDYTINIPSYRRSHIIGSKTLAMLDAHAIDRERVTVWVADSSEYETYRQRLDPSWRIEIASPGVLNARCHYHMNHPAGSRLVSIDDDVTALRVPDGNRLIELENLEAFIAGGFRTAEREGARIWGINAAANPLYMKQRYTVGLRYIIAAFFGSYAGDPIFDAANRNGQSSGEDFETSLMAFTRDGALLRHDGVTIKTAYFAEGGIAAELNKRGITDRQTDHHAQLLDIAARHPGLATTYTKAGGVTNIRLKPITAHQVPTSRHGW